MSRSPNSDILCMMADEVFSPIPGSPAVVTLKNWRSVDQSLFIKSYLFAQYSIAFGKAQCCVAPSFFQINSLPNDWPRRLTISTSPPQGPPWSIASSPSTASGRTERSSANGSGRCRRRAPLLISSMGRLPSASLACEALVRGGRKDANLLFIIIFSILCD